MSHKLKQTNKQLLLPQQADCNARKDKHNNKIRNKRKKHDPLGTDSLPNPDTIPTIFEFSAQEFVPLINPFFYRESKQRWKGSLPWKGINICNSFYACVFHTV